MRKILFVAAVLLGFSSTAFAQGQFGWGVKAGLNISGMSNTKMDVKTGLTAGVFADYQFFSWFGVSADLLYSRQGTAKKVFDEKEIYKTDYLNLPILANFYVLEHLAFKVGIQPGVNLGGKYKEKADGNSVTVTNGNAYKTFDFAIPIGVSYEFYDHIIVDARYNVGASNILINGSDVRNNVFAITVGYKF